VYLLMVQLGALRNTSAALIIPQAAQPSAIFLLRQSFMSALRWSSKRLPHRWLARRRREWWKVDDPCPALTLNHPGDGSCHRHLE